MRFGVLSFSIGPYDRLSERWKRFEALGFDDAWIADDLLVRGYADFESWTLLAALARDTERLRIGTMVTSIRFRHPALLAAQVLSVDEISGGRAAVTIGAGEPFQSETIGETPHGRPGLPFSGDAEGVWMIAWWWVRHYLYGHGFFGFTTRAYRPDCPWCVYDDEDG